MSNKLIVAVCILLLLGCTGDNPNDKSIRGKVSDFRLEDVNHRRFYLNQHDGKIVVVVFWATWCQVCKKYLKDLEKINFEWKENQIELVSIVVDPQNRDALKELLNSYIDVSYPVLLDREQKIMEKFGVEEIPTTVIIGRNKNIVMHKRGYDSATISQIRIRLGLLPENEN